MKDKSVLVADYSKRFIWLDGTIQPRTESQFRRILTKLNKFKTAPITFYIRGPGGDAYSAFSIMCQIVNSSSPVLIVAHGFVGSGCFTITQSGTRRLAIAGTKFTFHRCALNIYLENQQNIIQIEQSCLVEELERIRLIDAQQVLWFTGRGRPVKKILDLFISGSTLSLPKAKKLHLIDEYYRKEDFFKDRRIARRLIRA